MVHDSELSVLLQIRDLLVVLAEPQLEERRKRQQAALRQTVGKGLKRRKAVLLMDGTKNQSTIAKEAEMDPGGLSVFVKALKEQQLLTSNPNPELTLPVTPGLLEDETDE